MPQASRGEATKRPVDGLLKLAAGAATPKRQRFLQVRFQLPRHLSPGIARLDESTARQAQPVARIGIFQELYDRAAELSRVVRLEEVLAVNQRESFGADGGRDDGLGHRQRLEDLEPGSTAHAER